MADLKRVRAFLVSHPDLELIKDNNDREKVRCKLTKHELPCNLSAIESYTSGKKYQRFKSSSSEHERYKEFLIPHKKNRNQLYCQLTKKSINNIPHQIQQHVTGRRFRKALARHTSAQADEDRKDKGTEMWVPSDLESNSEDEDSQEADLERVSETKEEEDGEEFPDFSSDKDQESPRGKSVEVRTNKARKEKQTGKQKRKTEENAVGATPSKRAKEGKRKQSPKSSEKMLSKTKAKYGEERRKVAKMPKRKH